MASLRDSQSPASDLWCKYLSNKHLWQNLKTVVKDSIVMKHLSLMPVCDVVYARAITCEKMNEYEDGLFKQFYEFGGH